MPSKDRGMSSKKHKCKGPEVDTNLMHGHNTKIASTRPEEGAGRGGGQRAGWRGHKGSEDFTYGL